MLQAIDNELGLPDPLPTRKIFDALIIVSRYSNLRLDKAIKILGTISTRGSANVIYVFAVNIFTGIFSVVLIKDF